jgi:hypothetical protein
MPTITGWFRRGARGDGLLAYFTFRVSPGVGGSSSRNRRAEDKALRLLAGEEPSDSESSPESMRPASQVLEVRIMEHLVKRLNVPVEVNVFFRRGSLEIVALALGAYTVVKDYKTLRDSALTLRNDVVRPFVHTELGLQHWDVDETVWTPGDLEQAASVTGTSMDMGVRYAFLYLMISNIVLIIFLGLLFYAVLQGADLFRLAH